MSRLALSLGTWLRLTACTLTLCPILFVSSYFSLFSLPFFPSFSFFFFLCLLSLLSLIPLCILASSPLLVFSSSLRLTCPFWASDAFRLMFCFQFSVLSSLYFCLFFILLATTTRRSEFVVDHPLVWQYIFANILFLLGDACFYSHVLIFTDTCLVCDHGWARRFTISSGLS